MPSEAKPSIDAIYALGLQHAKELGEVSSGIARVEIRLDCLEGLYSNVKTDTAIAQQACNTNKQMIQQEYEARTRQCQDITRKLDASMSNGTSYRAKLGGVWFTITVLGAVFVGLVAIVGTVFSIIK